jgi:lysozyme
MFEISRITRFLAVAVSLMLAVPSLPACARSSTVTGRAVAHHEKSRQPLTVQKTGPPKGIDLYEGIGVVNFDKVKSAGYSFVIFRASFGIVPDTRYVENVRLARAAGMRIGAYCFFRPSQDLAEQIETCTTQIKAAGGFARGDIGVAGDFENPEAFKNIPRSEREAELNASVMAEWADVPVETRLGLIVAYLDGIAAGTGRTAIVYGSVKFFTTAFLGDLTPLENYPLLWVADYSRPTTPRVPAPWKTWTLWQRTPHGKVPGQKPNADIDAFNGDQKAFDSTFGTP